MTSLLVASVPRRRALRRAVRLRPAVHRPRRPERQSWGTMLYWAQNNEALQTGQYLWAIVPGVCIALLGAAFALLNYAFDEIGNPALRAGRAKMREQASPTRAFLSRCSRSAACPSSTSSDARQRSGRGRRRVVRRSAAGEFLGIVGESGCGKSTLLFAIAQLLAAAGRRITRGQVRFKGHDLVTLTDKQLRRDPLARPVGRHAERDERAQPGHDRSARSSRTRCGRTAIMAKRRDRGPLRRGAAAGRHRPGAPAQLSAPALRRDAAARDDRDGAAVHARPGHHGRAHLGARRGGAALADGADQGAAGANSASRSSSSPTTCRSSATSPTGCW